VEWNINADKYTSILEDNIWPVNVSRKWLLIPGWLRARK
jgi:hypothetical protein